MGSDIIYLFKYLRLPVTRLWSELWGEHFDGYIWKHSYIWKKFQVHIAFIQPLGIFPAMTESSDFFKWTKVQRYDAWFIHSVMIVCKVPTEAVYAFLITCHNTS